MLKHAWQLTSTFCKLPELYHDRRGRRSSWGHTGKASHVWMMFMYSKDSAHDLSVELSSCLCSCPGCKMAALSVNVITYLPLVTTVHILTAHNVVSSHWQTLLLKPHIYIVCVPCVQLWSQQCAARSGLPHNDEAFAYYVWSQKVLASVSLGLVCRQTISEAQEGRSKCYMEPFTRPHQLHWDDQQMHVHKHT